MEVDLLTRLYPDLPNDEIAAHLGRSASSVASKAHLMGLHKSSARLGEMGRRNALARHRWAEKALPG